VVADQTQPVVFLLGALLCALGTSLLGASAEDLMPFERLLVKDCSKAQQLVAGFGDVQKEENLPHLLGVLRLDVAAIKSEIPYQGPVLDVPLLSKAGHGEIAGDRFLRTFEPDRELRARRCALTILGDYGTAGLNSLGELFDLLSDATVESVDPGIDELIEQAITHIADAAKVNGDDSRRKQLLDQLLPKLLTHDAPAVRTLLIRWRDIALPDLLGRAASHEENERLGYLTLLVAADEELQEGRPLLVQALEDSRPEVRTAGIKWLSRVTLGTADFLGLIAPRLRDEVGDVRSAAVRIAVNRLSRVQDLKGLEISLPTAALLVGFLDGGDAELAPIIGAMADAPEYRPVFAQAAVSLLRQHGDQGASILAQLPRLGVEPHIVLELAKKALSSSEFDMRLAGIRAIGRAVSDRRTVVSEALRVIKRSTAEKQQRVALLAALGEVLVSPPIGVVGLPAVPFYIELFGLPEAECPSLCEATEDQAPLLVRAVRAVGEGVVPLLVRPLKSEHALVRSRALQVIAGLPHIPERYLDDVVALLQDSEGDIRDAAESFLKLLPPASLASALNHTARWSDKNALERVQSLKGH
jgi:hypothetical protein